jgi:peptidylprolyl isomerase
MRYSLVLLAILAAALGFYRFRSIQDQERELKNPPSFAQRMDEALKELSTTELVLGKGSEAVRGTKVTIHYESQLPDGAVFDSTKKRNQPVSFYLGVAEALPAWDRGIIGMKVGGKRRIESPPFLAYGESGIPGAVPANSRVVFEVELIGIGEAGVKSENRRSSSSRKVTKGFSK